MSEPPVSLEDLIKLKRHETPEGDFWAGFERDFQHRRLRALMDGDERPARFGVRFWRRLLLSAPIAGGAAAALAFLFVSTPGEPMPSAVGSSDGQHELASSNAPSGGLAEPRQMASMPASGDELWLAEEAQSRFVFDALASEKDSRSFRRVLSNASLSVPAAVGSKYVADPLTTARADAVPVGYRARVHF